ncbi:nuclear transport factor 2 family protein [Litoribrevibacter euphylliae]|uniref:Nuclear transport factor 2 family protein n=1 Tax=Litoribrevibacter euphylliae TaxID=1834034 RepID=A0ABV7HEF7_9GAMM
MNNEQQIQSVIQTYFECMYESSAQKAHDAFHPNAMITGYIGGGLQESTVGQFAELVASHQPSPKEKGEAAILDVLSIEVAGDTAVARVRDAYLGLMFLDTLSLIKVDGQWQIYNKLFHVEGELKAQ